MEENNIKDISQEAPYEEVMDEAYWQMLMSQATQETAEYVEDVFAIQDSVADSIKFAENADKNFKEAAKDALSAVEQLNEQLNDKNIESLDHMMGTLQSGIQDNILSDEQIKILEEAFKQTENWKSNPEVDRLVNGMKEKYPIRHAASEIKGHINDAAAELRKILDEVANIKKYYALTYSDYKKNLKATGDMILTKTQDNFYAIKTSALDTLRNGLEMSAKTLNYAASKFTEIVDKAKNAIETSIRNLYKFADKSLDMVTFGGYSKLMRATEKYNAEWVKNKESFPLASLININEKFAQKIRGADSETYWKEINDEAFFWGNIRDENNQVVDYKNSPLQNLEDNIKNKIEVFTNNLESFLDKSEAKIREIGKEVILACEHMKLSMEADMLGFKAEMAERISNTYEKQGRRVKSKIEKLEKTDKELFEIEMQLKSTLHKLTEVTPFERLPYQPNPNTMKAMEILKNAEPTKEVTFALRMIEKEIAKEKKRFDKEQDHAEVVYHAEQAVNAEQVDSLEGEIEKVKAKSDINLAKLQKAESKLQSIDNKSSVFSDIAEKSMGAANKVLQATDKVTDEYER